MPTLPKEKYTKIFGRGWHPDGTPFAPADYKAACRFLPFPSWPCGPKPTPNERLKNAPPGAR